MTVKYWGDAACTRAKDKQKVVKLCCFVWTKAPIPKPSIFQPQFGWDENWLCQAPVLCERRSLQLPVGRGLRPLLVTQGASRISPQRQSRESRGGAAGDPPGRVWDPPSCLPPPGNPQAGTRGEQSQEDQDSPESQEPAAPTRPPTTLILTLGRNHNVRRLSFPHPSGETTGNPKRLH